MHCPYIDHTADDSSNGPLLLYTAAAILVVFETMQEKYIQKYKKGAVGD